MAVARTAATFCRLTKRLQRDRAVLHHASVFTDYLRDEVARRLADRLLDIRRSHKLLVDLGSGKGHLLRYLNNDAARKVILCDMSRSLLYCNTAPKPPPDAEFTLERRVFDEEHGLAQQFAPNSVDIFTSSLAMHWINDIPTFLGATWQCLQNDGALLFAMLAGDTLYELRSCLQLAQMEREGGVSPRISPMVRAADVGHLLKGSNYHHITVDTEDIVVEYPTAFELMEDLKAMGESNALVSRQTILKRDTLIAAAAIYENLYGTEKTVPATFQVVYGIGWKPPAPTSPCTDRA